MADLLSPAERLEFTQAFSGVFDTLTVGRFVTVVKQPLETPVNPAPDQNLFGQGPDQGQSFYDYTPVTGVFPCYVRYNSYQDADLPPEIMARIYSGPVTIKVRKDARDFINNGPNEKFLLDGRTFLANSEEERQVFLDAEYYHFTLRSTK